jgi:hypothetical protein
VLTTSTVGKGGGFAKLRAVMGNASTSADEADLWIRAVATDVRCRQANAACPGGTSSDFDGELLLRSQIRLTDRASGFGGVSATVQDTTLQVPVPCTPTAQTGLGSTCEAVTTADTLVPNWVREEKHSLVSAFSFELRDPGPNGTGYGSGCPAGCGDGDEATYMVQGIFTGL